MRRGSAEYEAAAERFSEVMDLMQTHDIYTLDYQVGTVLGGPGFSEGGLGATDGGVFRRLADADCAGEVVA